MPRLRVLARCIINQTFSPDPVNGIFGVVLSAQTSSRRPIWGRRSCQRTRGPTRLQFASRRACSQSQCSGRTSLELDGGTSTTITAATIVTASASSNHRQWLCYRSLECESRTPLGAPMEHRASRGGHGSSHNRFEGVFVRCSRFEPV